MSNYPNMSYCACQNTAGALQQVQGFIQDAIEDEGGDEVKGYRTFLKNLSQEERNAFDTILEQVEQLNIQRRMDEEADDAEEEESEDSDQDQD